MSAKKININIPGWIIRTALSALLFIAVWQFWLVGHPEFLSYHEQYQLFLFTGGYLAERLSLPGGLADYLSEFIVQFYYVPWAGALLIALVTVSLQLLTVWCVWRVCAQSPLRMAVYWLSAIPAILVTWNMGDPNMLFSYPVALMLTLLCTRMLLYVRLSNTYILGAVWLAAFCLLYMCAGPVALLCPLMLYILHPVMSPRTLRSRTSTLLWGSVAYCAVIYLIARWLYPQYPLNQMYFGIDYYRSTNIHPAELLITAASVVAVALAARAAALRTSERGARLATASAAAAVILSAVTLVPAGYDRQVCDILRYDMYTRQERWQDILQLADLRTPTDDMSLQACNLALAKTGTLCDRMFCYPQRGIESLVAPYSYDNTSCLITAETFWHLGMVNSAYRYTFDLQEAVMNDRKSGRFCKRLAECLIINGKYKAARKFTERLRHSLFYSDWAERAESYMGDENKIAQHPVWGEIRRKRFKKEMLYDYPEIEKMLGILAIDSEGRNMLAWDYFNAALMLKGDLPTLTGMYHYAGEMFHCPAIPQHVQEAIGMYWTFSHPNFEGIPYPISPAVQQRIAAVARAAMQQGAGSTAWHTAAPGSFCAYFLDHQAANASPAEPSTQKGAPREG